ncbi:MAG: bifunctional (p)ppGpp synthetase/guanosine-3',5'-bis(diphosphate) 3'-pyrophosphohydrolase [Clostridia bacterium]|nr:bifunctional (p)ppGpp synthetase/guanosine-3',5'-bis(diphosphate) 3'-pyrophosphohydrolase [Clostridia bacterium]
MSAEYIEAFTQLLEKIKDTYMPEELSCVKKAYEYAYKAHDGQFRLSGEPYIIHPVAVACILADTGMDFQSLCAALLHDVVEDTPVTAQQINDLFGTDVAELVDGVTKLGKIPLSTKEEQQAENVRKMFLAMSRDIRVIIIKLADRVHNMRTLQYMSDFKRREKAKETLEIYARIAHRLGIRSFKEELEDLAIGYLDPTAYAEISQKLDALNGKHDNFLHNIIESIEGRVKKNVPDVTIQGRIKSVHGIFRKVYMQGKNFDEIYDIYAVRLIVNSVFDCYNCLGIIHDMYKPIPGRFKDYISTPKPNMYQSLHTTVISNDGTPFEVQIRTWEMHRTAEYGIAAHWKYKLGQGSTAKIEERLTWIRQLLESSNDAEDVEEIVRTIKSDLAPDEVYVFTPKGDVINLPMGATVIDFAYAIHSQVGHKMTGAKVDGRIVSLDYEVKTGEIIDILTSSQPGKGPSRDWLKIVVTSSARAKIRNWFKKERRDENIVEGRTELEREFRRSGIRLDEKEMLDFLQKIAERQHLKNPEELYATIGYGGLSIAKLMPRIKDDYSKYIKERNGAQEEAVVAVAKKTRVTDGVIVEGIDNCLVKFSHCCDPLPGDEIIGFITRGHGVSIHKRNCPNVPKNIDGCAEPERWLKAYWADKLPEGFRATLSITCMNRVGMLAGISGQLANLHVMIHSVGMKQSTDIRTVMYLTISVNSSEHLSGVMEKLKRLDGVLSVERTVQ